MTDNESAVLGGSSKKVADIAGAMGSYFVDNAEESWLIDGICSGDIELPAPSVIHVALLEHGLPHPTFTEVMEFAMQESDKFYKILKVCNGRYELFEFSLRYKGYAVINAIKIARFALKYKKYSNTTLVRKLVMWIVRHPYLTRNLSVASWFLCGSLLSIGIYVLFGGASYPCLSHMALAVYIVTVSILYFTWESNQFCPRRTYDNFIARHQES